MLAWAHERLVRDERGWTLMEMLTVVFILGVLLAIAVPAYLGFTGRAQTATAKANVRAALPTIEAYYADYRDYGFDRKADGAAAASVEEALQSYDPALVFSGPDAVTIVSDGGGTSYCVSAEGEPGEFWKKAGPSAQVSASAAPC
jgi:prepilin-type N-terminal cleavage/methylation domain-containing protein